MKIKLFYYIVSGGDGSAYPKFFTTAQKRDTYKNAAENDHSFEGFCDADGHIELEIAEDGTFKPTSKWDKFDQIFGE